MHQKGEHLIKRGLMDRVQLAGALGSNTTAMQAGRPRVRIKTGTLGHHCKAGERG